MTESMKACSVCGEQILAVARKCRYCGAYLDASARPPDDPPGVVERSLVPIGRPLSAIASGYFGLFAALPLVGIVPAILAVITGYMALQRIRQDPSLCGKGRAWFGIVVGVMFGTIWLVTMGFMASQS